MANYMFVLRPCKETRKVVCPTCASRGEVLNSCRVCGGSGIKKETIPAYCVQDKPIEIVKVDRDPKTGILRYWEGACDYFYETVDSSLNKYVPDVPYGIHLCHDTKASAQHECERINTILKEIATTKNKIKEICASSIANF